MTEEVDRHVLRRARRAGAEIVGEEDVGVRRDPVRICHLRIVGRGPVRRRRHRRHDVAADQLVDARRRKVVRADGARLRGEAELGEVAHVDRPRRRPLLHRDLEDRRIRQRRRQVRDHLRRAALAEHVRLAAAQVVQHLEGAVVLDGEVLGHRRLRSDARAWARPAPCTARAGVAQGRSPGRHRP